MTYSAQNLAEQLFGELALEDSGRYYVAYSGGLDSTVLLHMLSVLQAEYGFSLTALHVNHNLYHRSGHWSDHCARICERLGVEFKHTSLTLESGSESEAREARYQWFSKQILPASVLLTAHHRQDRAETLLFNLMRGAGSTGLSSLRATRPFFGSRLVRPLLALSQDEILQYANQHQLAWVEDPSNKISDYSRNHIRNEILPVLTEFRHDAVQSIARAAANLEQENNLLREVAICDLVEVREHPKHPLDQSHALCFEDINHLSPARQVNLVRFWLRSLHLHTPSQKFMQRLLTAFVSPPNSTAVLQEAGSQFRFYRGFMYVMPAQDETQSFATIDWQNVDKPVDLYQRKIRVDATSKLRELLFSHSRSNLRLAAKPEVINPKALQGHSLNLKKWLQEIGVPPWRRQAMPLLTISNSNSDVVLGPVDQQLQSDWVLLDHPIN
ncbi:MAG: tRNA(Ile)-lysidine synthase [Cryomorphaceae bacterium]|jgi:tRNA(Ile)-lysidine synthase